MKDSEYWPRLQQARTEYVSRGISSFIHMESIQNAIKNGIIKRVPYWSGSYWIIGEQEEQSCCGEFMHDVSAILHIRDASHIARKYNVKPSDVYKADVALRLLREIS